MKNLSLPLLKILFDDMSFTLYDCPRVILRP